MTASNNTTLLGYMGRDQYGETYHLVRPKFPRKQLLDKLGYSSARKMYVDSVNGEAKHTGYVIGRHWITLYEVREWANAA